MTYDDFYNDFEETFGEELLGFLGLVKYNFWMQVAVLFSYQLSLKIVVILESSPRSRSVYNTSYLLTAVNGTRSRSVYNTSYLLTVVNLNWAVCHHKPGIHDQLEFMMLLSQIDRAYLICSWSVAAHYDIALWYIKKING